MSHHFVTLLILVFLTLVFADPEFKKPSFKKGKLSELDPARLNALHKHLKTPQKLAKTAGTTFIFAFPNSHISPNDTSYTERLSVTVTNVDPSTTAAITITSLYPNFTTINTNVPPGTSQLIDITPADIQANYMDRIMNRAVLENKGLKLTSTVPVEVVASNVHTDGGSGDSFDLIPVCQLGKAYRTVSDEGTRRGQNATNIFTVVALQDNTSITTDYLVTWQPPLAAGQTASFVSQWWQTDTHVEATGPVSVISAAVCGYGYSNAQGCGHEAIMMTPITAWGTQFPFAKLRPQNRYEVLVIGTQDGTNVTANGEYLDTIDDGWYLIVWNDECDYIESTKPTLVVIVGNSDVNGNGAPYFVQATPTSQFTSGSVQFATGMTTTDASQVQHYVRVTTALQNVGKFSVDGWFPNALNYMRAGRSTYYYADVPIGNGTHVVSGATPDIRFTVTVYGFGLNIGYAFTPGLELPTDGSIRC